MRPRLNGIIIAVFGICMFGSFIATYAWQAEPARPAAPARPAKPAEVLGGWLRLMPEQLERVASVDPAFAEESARMEAELASEREALATMFEDADTTDEALLRQVETVITVHDQLERRVAAHLLALRPHLTDAQRSKLFQTCAKGIRESGGWRWRHGHGHSQGEARGANEAGHGGGDGGGHGAGQGHGRRWRGGRGSPPPAGHEPPGTTPTSHPGSDDEKEHP